MPRQSSPSDGPRTVSLDLAHAQGAQFLPGLGDVLIGQNFDDAGTYGGAPANDFTARQSDGVIMSCVA